MRIDLDFTDEEIGMICDALFELSRSPAYSLSSLKVMGLLEDVRECVAIAEKREELSKKESNLERRRYEKKPSVLLHRRRMADFLGAKG